MDNTWSPRLGDSVGLSLDPDSGSLSVRMVARAVSPARETAVQKFLYTPRLWASALAGMAVFLLMGTALASGSIKPAPPPAPTPVPGQPTPTPDTRPRLQLPGFVLEAPAPPAPVPAAAPARTPEERATALQYQELNTPQDGTEAPAAEEAPPPSQACNNPFGIGCGPAQPPPPRPRPRTTSSSAPPPPPPQPAPCSNPLGIGCSSPPPPPPNGDAPEAPPSEVTGPAQVIPVPSPGPGADARERALGLRPQGPPAGSNLDDALRAASIATQNFKTGLTTRSTNAGE